MMTCLMHSECLYGFGTKKRKGASSSTQNAGTAVADCPRPQLPTAERKVVDRKSP